MHSPLDREYLIKTFAYCRETGRLIHQFRMEKSWDDVAHNRTKAGKAATYISKDGGGRYSNCVFVSGAKHAASRVIWVIVTGEDPTGGVIDHINRDQLDDRFENLRMVDWAVNARNRSRPKNNTTGYLGVHKPKHGSYCFHVQGAEGRVFKYGFLTARDAAIARDEMAKVIHGSAYVSSVEEHDRLTSESSDRS